MQDNNAQSNPNADDEDNNNNRKHINSKTHDYRNNNLTGKEWINERQDSPTNK